MQVSHLEYLSRDYLAHLRRVAENPAYRSLPLPLASLQAALGGLRMEEVTILGGFEGHGKSALAQQIAFAVADSFRADPAEDRRLVLYASLEMGRYQLMARHLVQQSGMALDKLLNPERLDGREWDRVEAALDDAAGLPLVILDDARQSIGQIGEAIGALEAAGEGTVRLVVVDYLHLLADCAGGEVARLDAAITELKDLARKASCHILTLARLNRNVQPGQLPNSHNLAGSQGLAYGADNVCFVHRPKLIDHSLESDWENLAYFIVDKARNGPVGLHRLVWQPDRLCYRDPNEWENKRRWSLPRPSQSYS